MIKFTGIYFPTTLSSFSLSLANIFLDVPLLGSGVKTEIQISCEEIIQSEREGCCEISRARERQVKKRGKFLNVSTKIMSGGGAPVIILLFLSFFSGESVNFLPVLSEIVNYNPNYELPRLVCL